MSNFTTNLKKCLAAFAAISFVGLGFAGLANAQEAIPEEEVEVPTDPTAEENPPVGDNDFVGDRPPSKTERAAIEKKLKEYGFVSYEHIELDDEDDIWEVDDAKTADGEDYDLKLSGQTLALIEKDD